MNIYITDKNLSISAHNLDTVTLKKQLMYLVQIFSNCVVGNDLYKEVFEDLEYPMNIMGIKSILKPPLLVEHETTKWAMQTPIHTLFIADYLDKCYEVLKTKRHSFTMPMVKIKKLVSRFIHRINEILPTRRLNSLYDLDNDLYRNTPSYLDSEKNVIESYKLYLTKRWKSVILRQFEYQATVSARLVQSASTYPALPVGDKPRKPAPLKWGGYNLQNIPAFASKELNAYIKELKDAKDNTPDCRYWCNG